MSAAIYELLQSKKGASSGVGTSYYGAGSTCGMKGRLQEVFPYEEVQGDGSELTATGRRKVDARRCGTFYHALQEMWRLETVAENLIVAADHTDYDFELALNSFAKYRQHFKNDRHNMGVVKGAEVRIPEQDAEGKLTPLGEEQQRIILEFTGGYPFSLRYDLLTDASDEHLANIAVTRGLALPGTGDYLVDYKLVGSITPATQWQYSYEFQQLAYPVIYNLVHPERPVKGMITDVMARVLKPEDRHFALYLAYADERAAEIVRYGVRRAAEIRKLGQTNAFSCLGKYGPCYFLTSGICPRHGVFDDFTFENGRAELKQAS